MPRNTRNGLDEDRSAPTYRVVVPQVTIRRASIKTNTKSGKLLAEIKTTHK